jgi:hypothetical protein
MTATRIRVGGYWIALPAPALYLSPPPASSGTLRMLAGIGGPVGITIDGRSAPAYSGEWVAFKFGLAPQGLATYRQLAANGLRPGGAQPVAELSWWHGRSRRIAYLYDVAAAKPKRPMTPAKTAALAKAMRAKRTCPDCRRALDYVIPKSLGRCVDCEYEPNEPPADQTTTDCHDSPEPSHV